MKQKTFILVAAIVIVVIGLSCGGLPSSPASPVTPAASAPWVGIKQLGVSGYATQPNSIAIDNSGNVYIAGYTTGGLDGNTLTGTYDFFLTKYNSSGVKQYTKQLGVTGNSTAATAVAIDSSGNIFVGGFTGGGLDGNSLTGTGDVFLTKYSSSGVKQYTKQLGVSGSSTAGTGVAIDSSDNVYVCGWTAGGLDGNTLTGVGDVFVTKYNSSGVKQYTKQLGIAGANTTGRSVTIDSSDNVYVCGSTTGGLDGNTLTGSGDFFLTKYNSSGVKQYTKQLGVAGAYTEGKSVAIDSSDNVYVGGGTDGGLDGNTLTGTSDLFITKYNSSGVKQYTKQLGVATKMTLAHTITIDSSGNVYIGGRTTGGLDGNTLTGTDDYYMTKYNSSGVKQYTRQLGVSGAGAECWALTTDNSDNVFLTGITSGGFDGNTVTGTVDYFIAKYSASGVKQ